MRTKMDDCIIASKLELLYRTLSRHVQSFYADTLVVAGCLELPNQRRKCLSVITATLIKFILFVPLLMSKVRSTLKPLSKSAHENPSMYTQILTLRVY